MPPHKDLILNNVIYVPRASKFLLSVHKLARDNDAYFEFHPSHFFIKDQTSKTVLHKGRVKRRPLPLEVLSE